ncbi:MAG: hypothetical protein LC725_08880 [Lentisphaerae bacterium]|nr:hypothetical protein [Lentisphaerota bacterium]
MAGDTPKPEYFDYPEGFATQNIPGIKPVVREPVDWTIYFDTPLKPGTIFSMGKHCHVRFRMQDL